MKSLSLAEPGCECIPSSEIVAMELRRLAREQVKPVTITVGEVPKAEGRWTRWLMKIGVFLMGCLGILVTVHIIIGAVK